MGLTSYTVYWTEYPLASITVDPATGTQGMCFAPVPHMHLCYDLKEALDFSEALRKRRKAGEDIWSITMVSENPDSVGQAGVDVTGPDYDWKKRRV